MNGRSSVQRGIGGFALGSLMIFLSGCEAEYYETVVYEEPGYTHHGMAYGEVMTETHFIVLDEYGVVLEEVEVTWETVPDYYYEETTYYIASRRSGRHVMDTGGLGAVPLSGDRDNEILFRFRKSGYHDVWASSRDMALRERDGLMILEHEVVLPRR